MKYPRRKFIAQAGKTLVAGGVLSSLPLWLPACSPKASQETSGADSSATTIVEEPVMQASSELFFQISLAQWSLHRLIFAGEMDNLDFAATARKEFDISAVEYVSFFFKDKAKDEAYLSEMKKRADDNGVQSLLIMVDAEGDLGDASEKKRKTAVENHYKWVEAAKFLGCHTIRVNAAGEGNAKAVAAAAIESLGALSTFAKDYGINVVVENHGGYSSDGSWLAHVISSVGMDNCGTLPDFGNFCIERSKPEAETMDAVLAAKCLQEYDRYKGVEELLPFAKGVSAKTYDFDEKGEETSMEYVKLMQLVKNAGYTGHVGIEYEGSRLDPMAGIRATKALLERAGAQVG